MPDSNDIKLREAIKTALQAFESKTLRDASLALLKTLGYQSDKTITVPKSDPSAFLGLLAEHNPDVTINKEKALFEDWKKADLLFQLTDEELVKERTSFKTGAANTQLHQSYLFFTIELNQQDYARGKLIAIARQLNRVFPMPVMVLIKHGRLFSVAVINRRQNKRDSEKDVLGKATIIRDISLVKPHTGHIQILSSFALQNLKGINNFDTLHAAWEEILNVELLNKKFYNELSNWHLWAINEVSFPGEPTRQSFFEKTGSTDERKLEEAIQEHNAKNVIRLLTRFLFVWFIKEKQLIPDELFDPDYLQKEMLKDLSPYHDDGLFKSVNIQSHYYKAILQNLFFATLNQEMGKRAFRRSGQNMNVTNLLRYENCFKDPEKFIELAEKYTPFMNGGLFECLDKPHPTKKGRKGGDVIIFEDGFSDRTDNLLKVPDYLFFGQDEDVDLSDQYGSKAKKYKQAAVKGLINIFNSYKFTIAENTPIDQEIALDPELLGKVFENLLASYNPETRTTARKQTGSFYTPREIVGYMVDESLIAYLKNEVEGWGVGEEELDTKLHELLSYNDSNPFQQDQSLQKKIIRALDHCKILDPACGSGAFPMGILQKMVHILQKVDPENTYWQELQMENAVREAETVFHLDVKEAREQKLIEINEAFDQKINDPDYARKLFLIENCIYGVDIQPIATQISKLRFFISLVVDQNVDKNKDNFGIRPLPNLETKFVAANTLIGIDNQGRQMTLDNPEIKKLESELIDIRHRIFSAKTPRTKRKLRDEDKEVREKMGELLIEDGWASKTANQLSGWDPYDQNVSSDFFDPEWMFGIVDGFDVVIGNPPYIGERKNKHVFLPIQNSPTNKYYLGRMDYFYFFFHIGIDLLKVNGICSLITTNYFVTALGAKKLRADLKKRTTLLSIINFNEAKVFDSAAGQHNMITTFKKGKHDHKLKLKVSEKNSLVDKNYLTDFINANNWILLSKNKYWDGAENYLRISGISDDSSISNILDMIIEKSTDTLGNVCKPLIGLESSLDSVYVNSKEYFENVIESKNEFDYIKPFFKNSDIQRYKIKKTTERYILYLHEKIPDIKQLKGIYKYLLDNENKIKSRKGANLRGAFKRGNWWVLNTPRLDMDFNDEKIVTPYRSKRNRFAYSDNAWYASRDVYYIVKQKKNVQLKYILALLNSKLFYLWFFHRGKRKGDMLELYAKPLKEVPILEADNDTQNTISSLVDMIMFVEQSNSCFLTIDKALEGCIIELYFSKHMNKKMINIKQFVEKDMAEVIKGKDFKKLPSSEKENIINQLHARWTHPDSEVRNRIKLFAVRSPDVLKPILESR